ncbi:hypothetical protein LCGC14_3003670 [marine sediment metagenome]|uniref:Uncharacterized protein n=1 Tax=marine sediment metagenome TaxID=412755 RepID=A0A0F8Z7X2_9ZZZZ
MITIKDARKNEQIHISKMDGGSFGILVDSNNRYNEILLYKTCEGSNIKLLGFKHGSNESYTWSCFPGEFDIIPVDVEIIIHPKGSLDGK